MESYIDEKSCKNILTLNTVKQLYLIINKINGYIEERSNGSKYLTLYVADGNQRHNEKYERLWDKLEILLDQQAITEMIMIRNI